MHSHRKRSFLGDGREARGLTGLVKALSDRMRDLRWIRVAEVGGVDVDHPVLGKNWLVLAGVVPVGIEAELGFDLVDRPTGRPTAGPVKEDTGSPWRATSTIGTVIEAAASLNIARFHPGLNGVSSTTAALG